MDKAREYIVKLQKESGGFTAGYHILKGWLPEYPEITGYTIPTLLRIGEIERAKRAADWLVKIQNPDGSFPDYAWKNTYVFDAGQILLGLIEIYRYSGDERYQTAAERTAKWLIEQQDDNGAFVRHTYGGKPRTYHSRVGWALVLAGKTFEEKEFLDAGVKNIEWAISQQQENGMFRFSGFATDKDTVLHTLAYTTRGILETGLLLKNEKYTQAAVTSIEKLAEIHFKYGILPGYFNDQWEPTSKSKCITGLAQTAILFLKAYKITDDPKYLAAGIDTIEYLEKVAMVRKGKLAGALPGSVPIWGRYQPFMYPTWAVKFYLDAKMLLDEVVENTDDVDAEYTAGRFAGLKDTFLKHSTLNPDDPRVKNLKDYADAFYQKVVVDLGCGTGRYAPLFKKFRAKKIIGIDPTGEFIAFAKEKYGNIAEFRIGSATKIPLENNSVDVVVAIESLQHAKDIDSALREINRVLRQGGRLIIIDRNPVSIRGLLKPLLEKMGKWMYPAWAEKKEKWYTLKEWKKHLGIGGFLLEDVRKINMDPVMKDRMLLIIARKR